MARREEGRPFSAALAGGRTRPFVQKPRQRQPAVVLRAARGAPHLGVLQSCGKRYTKVTSSRSRVVGGMVALAGSHPYMAAIFIGEQFCGGSLISSCWVLTAAHCFENRPNVSLISVVLGHTLYNPNTVGSTKVRVQNYLLHENYSVINKHHDIALVRLKEDKEKAPGHCVEFSRYISPVCLPSLNKTALNISEECQIAGWGYMYEGATHLAKNLQEAHVPIMPEKECRSAKVLGNHIAEGMLCAGYLDGRADACQGDSGGPLVCEEQGRATLRGIVSWGLGCAQMNKPGVYTNVTHYLDWIQSKVH
uniref:Peptidase S1 domain-containing protein n=1 Tax=Varanus komodoensis TaxID=61221 RepID=A0A8D2LJG6_VARKO